jgi:hypothetical protein
MREFDRSILKIMPLEMRCSDINLSSLLPLKKITPVHPAISEVARRIKAAKKTGAATIFIMGAHVTRSGVQRYLIDLMEKGCISCLAMNGAGLIHDYEFALVGETTESVAKYIKEGQFGLWEETGRINDIVNEAHKNRLGMGEAVGRAIQEGDFPHRGISVLAAGYRLRIPVTVHVGIGYDIIHEHPNCDGAAIGATSYRDFLRFARVVENLENGVLVSLGSAIMAPEVFLKCLSMARNVARQNGRVIRHFTTLVCDLHDLPEDLREEAPKDSPAYYFRPWKTLLVRTVADGGQSFYVRGAHDHTIPALWSALQDSGA